ncbi:MAG: hypothetical protein HUJ25_09965 [Crocinitomicaceae bacterium]|nr:hypothetical protein [Crocinitomicaceae bacterium]
MSKVRVIVSSELSKVNPNTLYEHWVNYSGYNVLFCTEVNCLMKDPLGAEVQFVDSTERQTYIVPLCNHHATSGLIIDIGETFVAPLRHEESSESFD